VRITGIGINIEFDTITGMITGYQFNGIQLIKRGIIPNFWRAPTDNDFGNKLYQRAKIWKRAGAKRLVRSFDVSRMSPHEIRVEVVYMLDGINNDYKMVYSILGSGEILVHTILDTKTKELPELPRYGVNFRINDAFTHVEWLGRGPHENYSDRKSSAFVGKYVSSVDELYFPYIRPQENGTRTSVRWMVLTDKDGSGIMITGMPEVSVSALPYATNDLDYTASGHKHTVDLEKRDFIDLNIDLKQSGVGGNDSWGAKPLPEYRLPAGRYEFSFKLKPVKPGDDLDEVLRTVYKIESF
jgi:beta-galactosidase